MKKIKVNELKTLFDKIIYKLHNFENLEEIEVDRDIYRYIPTNKWEAFGDTSEPFIGYLQEDIDELKKTLQEPINGAFISYTDLDKIANLLHYISDKMNPVNDVSDSADL